MWNKQRMHELLDNNPKAVMRAVVAIYNLQTESEKASHATTQANNVGFSAFDAEFLTDMAMKINRGWGLTPKQMAVTRNKIKRYHRQLCDIANAKGGMRQMNAVEPDVGNLEELRMIEEEARAINKRELEEEQRRMEQKFAREANLVW